MVNKSEVDIIQSHSVFNGASVNILLVTSVCYVKNIIYFLLDLWLMCQ
jgi:hypothetical protein